MIRKARAVWRGSGRGRKWRPFDRLWRACKHAVFIQNRFESEKGTNLRSYSPPHTRVLHDGLGFRLQRAGYTPTELNTEAAITLEQDKEGFRVSLSALTLRASVPNLDQDTFARLARDAEQNCPVSRVLRAEITLDAKLV